MRLADIGSGTLCVESAYPTAMQFVLRDPQHPVKIIEDEINVCVDKLINGTVQAVFTDQPVLQWMVANYQISDGYVSPLLGPNPFSFVYASGSLLRQYVRAPPRVPRSACAGGLLVLTRCPICVPQANPSIIAAQARAPWHACMSRAD